MWRCERVRDGLVLERNVDRHIETMLWYLLTGLNVDADGDADSNRRWQNKS